MKTAKLNWTTFPEASYDNGVMRLTYFNGKYQYYRVSKDVFDGFITAQSPQDYWYDVILKIVSEACICELNGCHG